MYERIARPRNLFSFFLLFWCYDSSSVCTPDEKKRGGEGARKSRSVSVFSRQRTVRDIFPALDRSPVARIITAFVVIVAPDIKRFDSDGITARRIPILGHYSVKRINTCGGIPARDTLNL